MRNIKKTKPKRLVIYDKEGMAVGTDKEQVKIITEHYTSFFENKDGDKILDIKPIAMKKSFTGVEIQKAANKLKNNKSAGFDNIHAEQMKYSPIEIHNEIARLLNITAETGKKPEAVRKGILVPSQNQTQRRKIHYKM